MHAVRLGESGKIVHADMRPPNIMWHKVRMRIEQGLVWDFKP